MSSTGYSGAPLINKLGIKPSMGLLLMNPPADYYQMLEHNLSPQLCGPGQIPDLVHLFAASKKIFEKEMKSLNPLAKKNTSIIIWVSWYKKSSKFKTDLSEDDIRNYALANGLVDIKVCAVSEDWSGLKLVVPLALR